MNASFRRHPWPYASAFSLIGCYARINVLDRKDLLGQWLSSKRSGRVEQHLDWETVPNTVGVGTLCRSFDLVPEAVSLAFDLTAWWPGSLRFVAERTQSCLRYCPECINQGYHSGLFQLPWWRVCPIHGEPILDRCPNCAEPIPISLDLSRGGVPHRLFLCRRCGFDLANSAAIVAASHQAVPEVLHRVVGVHRRWTLQVDSHYVVPPIFSKEYWLLTGEDALALLSLSQVPLPIELRSFTEVPTPAPTFPLHIKIRREGPVGSNLALQLVNCLTKTFSGVPEIGDRMIALDWHRTKRLIAVERRLQHSFGKPITCAHWDWLHTSRSTKAMSPTWEEGFRERGYRRRIFEMKVAKDLAGDSSLEIKDSELQRLTSVKLVLGLTTFLGTQESREPDHRPLRQIASWWYEHFLILALIDATIYATHVNSYIDHDGSDPYLEKCWPSISLDRQPPGHDWGIAATYQENVLEAYIMSWPLGLLTGPRTLA